MRLAWLADVLLAEGLKVVESQGWKGRGKELDRVEGVVLHHTATGPDVPDGRVDTLLIVGRPDLNGPLCQLGLRRDGSFYVVADGKGNHNGFGRWGNQSIGIEAYNDGVGEPWPREQLDAYQRGTAAILRHLGLDVSRAQGHREQDPKRKIDPAGIDLPAFRASVEKHMTAGPTPPPPGDDFLMALTDEQQGTVLAGALAALQVQEEVVGVTDGEGDTRQDRVVDILNEIKADQKAILKRLDALEA
jgi:hypothetical protein